MVEDNINSQNDKKKHRERNSGKTSVIQFLMTLLNSMYSRTQS